MVADARTGDLLMSNEVFQEWLAPDPGAREQTLTDTAAAEAAQRLLSKALHADGGLRRPGGCRDRAAAH